MDPHTREQNQKIRPILDGFFMFDGLKKVAVVPIDRGIRPRQSKTRQPLVEKRITGSPDFDRSGCPKTTKTRRKPRVSWCRQRDLNSRPDDYKSTALPTELCRHRLQKSPVFRRISGARMVPLAWIGHATPSLPRKCSTTELQRRQDGRYRICPPSARKKNVKIFRLPKSIFNPIVKFRHFDLTRKL